MTHLCHCDPVIDVVDDVSHIDATVNPKLLR